MDVRQPRAAHADRRLHAALRRRHLRQGSRARARHWTGAALPAAADRRGASALPDGGRFGARPRGRCRRRQGLREARGHQRQRRQEAAMNKLGIATACGLGLAILAVAIYAWSAMAATPLDTHRYIALTLGIVATLALAVVLVGLMLYSNRSGQDDRAGRR